MRRKHGRIQIQNALTEYEDSTEKYKYRRLSQNTQKAQKNTNTEGSHRIRRKRGKYKYRRLSQNAQKARKNTKGKALAEYAEYTEKNAEYNKKKTLTDSTEK